MPVEARRLIRKMRGGAQAHLIKASDGHCYVVKFTNNPQHRRILINEWISSTFLAYLGIATPAVTFVQITQDFLDQNPDAFIQLGSQRREIQDGLHFGSRFPGDPARTVVYDFLPDTLIEKVENLADFTGILAFDKWMGNADSRQAIFYRARVAEWGRGPETPPQRVGFVAEMVDNGYVLDGPHWRFGDSPIQGLYFRPLVYRKVRGMDSFEPWLQRIRYFPEEVVDQALKSIPTAWCQDASAANNDSEKVNDRDALEQLMERLLRRRSRVGDLIEACRGARNEPFPSWLKK
ncbi:MAG: HipA family kinase [Acidobacteriota bacterium]